MPLQLRKLLCLIITMCLTACASAPAYQVDKDNPSSAFEALSHRLVVGERIIVALRDKEILNMRFSEATGKGLVGWVDHYQGYQADDQGRVIFAWEDIDRVELESGDNRAATVGKVLLVAVLIIGAAGLVALSSSGIGFSDFNYGGGGGG